MMLRTLPSHDMISGETMLRHGFDVIMAVTSARQAASPAARILASLGQGMSDRDEAAIRRALLGGGAAPRGSERQLASRFLETRPFNPADGAAEYEANENMNAAFTRAFQPMVKHGALIGSDKAGEPSAAGREME